MNTSGKILIIGDTERAAMSEELRSRMVALSDRQAVELEKVPRKQRIQHYADNYQSVGTIGSKMLKELIKKSRK